MEKTHEETNLLIDDPTKADTEKLLAKVDTQTLLTQTETGKLLNETGTDQLLKPAGEDASPAHPVHPPEAAVEKTGELMAASRQRGGKTILLIVLAVLVAVGAAAVFLNRGSGGGSGGASDGGGTGDGGGSSSSSGLSYEEYLSLGEKYFAEGNYEQAEVNFLAAVGMMPREVQPRRGLAYTYAVQGKFTESKAVYDELYEDTGDEIYQTASAEVADNRVPVSLELIPIPPEYADLTRTAFADHAGRYFYDFAGGEYWPLEYPDGFELITWWSYVMLTLNEDGSFTVLTNQYEAYTDIHTAGADEVRRSEAVGRFICVGQNDDGAYILRLIALTGTTTDSDDYVFLPYFDPTDGQDYELPTTYRAFDPAQGFANAGEFLLSGDTLVNVGGGQTFTSEWNHAIGE